MTDEEFPPLEFCSKCGVGPRRPSVGRYSGTSYCRECHNAYQRARRPRHSDLPFEARQRANARAMANVYQRRGLLIPSPCENCGAEKAQKHHDDYSRPLDVRWLCAACHRAHHKAEASFHNAHQAKLTEVPCAFP